MRLHRFLIDQALTEAQIRITDKDLLHQWVRVLRYTDGDRVTLLDGKGREVIGQCTDLSLKAATVHVETRREESIPEECPLTLSFSPLKRELTEQVFQKGTELGVTAFQPILCARTVRDGFNPERIARILKEATEQSGRLWLPTFQAPIPFEMAIQQTTHQCAYIATLTSREGEGRQTSKEVSQELAVFVGPEGGWTEEEEMSAQNAGIVPLSLSRQVLRAETACLAAVALLRAESLN